METLTTEIIIQGIVVTIVKNMDMLLKIPLEHILEVTRKDGLVKLHVLDV